MNAQRQARITALESALAAACDALLMLSIKGSNELPAVSWDDLETVIPTTVEDLEKVLETRRAEALAAWRIAHAVLGGK